MIKTDNKYKRCFYIRKKQQPKSHRSLLLTEYYYNSSSMGTSPPMSVNGSSLSSI